MASLHTNPRRYLQRVSSAHALYVALSVVLLSAWEVWCKYVWYTILASLGVRASVVEVAARCRCGESGKTRSAQCNAKLRSPSVTSANSMSARLKRKRGALHRRARCSVQRCLLFSERSPNSHSFVTSQMASMLLLCIHGFTHQSGWNTERICHFWTSHSKPTWIRYLQDPGSGHQVPAERR